MNILVDTCGWIEWIAEGTLIASFEPYFKKLEELIVPTLIQFELFKWTAREKDELLALEVVGLTENGIVVPLDTTLALAAADYAAQYKLAMADAIIYATSRSHDALLVTSDRHFKELPHVKYIEKITLTI